MGSGTQWRQRDFRLFVTDVASGEVAFIGTIREEARNPGQTTPAVMALRLKVVNRQIAEIETFVVRNDRAAANIEKLGQPNHLFLQTIPEGERASRADLISHNEATNPDSQCAGYAVIRKNLRRRAAYERSWSHV